MSKENSVQKQDCRDHLTSLGTFESHAIVLLLCAPTEVQKAWRMGDGAAFDAACAYSGLSDDAIKAARKLRDDITARQEDGVFFEVGATLKELAYGCVEPHPDPNVAKQIVCKIRELDGNDCK